ncbi:MAG: response regulator transcription factor [Nevskia sp.]|nr:response regulator transcription factor [Nevskia sp.]
MKPEHAVPDPRAAPRVLLVDDDQKLTRLFTEFLQEHGLKVGVAADGVEGLRRLRAEPWDLVVLDVMLPRLNGFETLRALRGFSEVPVLMLTARGGDEDRVGGLESGADDYVAKTASARELLARIRNLLRRAAAGGSPAPQEYHLGGLRIDGASFGASLDGRPLSLTRVEFDLLLTLARNCGQVCTREYLLEQVRDRQFEAFDRSIDVHIASLRRKLGDDARTPRYIRTVRATGYLLLEPGAASP